MTGIQPIAFLDAVSGYVRSSSGGSADRPIRLAVVDPAYVAFGVGYPYPGPASPAKVKFEGETTVSGKAYAVADGFVPSANQRVYLVPIGTTYLIIGGIGGQLALGFYALPGSSSGVELGGGSYFDSDEGLVLETDAYIDGDLSVGGIGAFLYKMQTADGPSVVSTATTWSAATGLYLDLPVGTWEVHINPVYTCTVGDIQTRWAFTGTLTGGKSAQGASPFTVGTATVNDTNGRDSASARNSWHQYGSAVAYGGNDTSGYIAAHEWGIVQVTVTGRLSLEYTQRVSNAAATIMRAVSYMTARRVA